MAIHVIANQAASGLALDRNVTDAERARLADLLPEVEWLEEPARRETVLEIWAHAWRISGWADPADAHSVATLPRWNLISHTRAVVNQSRSLATSLSEFSSLDFDFEELITIALLHDVAKLSEFEPGTDGPVKSQLGETLHHATIGAQWALEAGLPHSVAHAIYTHTPQVAAAPRTPEGLVVQMVDHTLAEVTRLATRQESDQG